MIYLLSKDCEQNIALRFSEFEGIDTILNMSDKVKWVWVDCFSKLPITQENYKFLHLQILLLESHILLPLWG